jgi:outer membrane protein assembly factor BamB
MSGRMALAAMTITGMAMAAWPASATASTHDDWSTFHHDTMHTGVSTDAAIGATQAPSLNVQWSHPVGAGDPVFASPAVVYNATLAKTLVYEVSVGGTVHAFDTTGASIWTSPQNIGAGAVASPAIDGNSLYIGSDNGVLTALDATTGALQCSFTLPTFAPETAPGRIEDAPVVGHDTTGAIVYFGDTGQSESVNHGHEWAINGAGNRSGACTQKWTHDLATTGAKRIGSWSPPALGTDSTGRPLLVFGSNQPDDAVYALDARDGSLVWRFQTLKNFPDADVGAGPTISAPGVNGFSHGVVYIDGKDRIEYAIDLLTGAQLWQFDMQADSAHSTNSVSCAALVGNLVVVAYWKYVYAFNATTGALVWRSVGGAGSTVGSVSVSGGSGDQVVLRGDLSGNEYAYRLSDGALLKTVKVAATRLDASTAVAAGMAFIAGEDGNLYGLSEAPSAGTGSITGKVTDASTSAAISGATVSCPACPTTTTTTDPTGMYTFSSVPAGGYNLSFSASGYASVNNVAVTVTSGNATTQDEALTPAAQTGSITGKVTDASTSAAISGATVSCPACPTSTATTDTSGVYTFSAVPQGNYSLSFSASGYAAKNNVPVTVTAGSATTQDEALAAAPFIFSDGFESGDFSAWTSSTGLSVESTVKHSGTYSAQGNVSSLAADARKLLPSTYTAGYERVWFDLVSQSTQVYVLQANTAANIGVAIVYVNSKGILGLQAADGTRHDSPTAVTANTWHEIELRFTISGTTSSADVWFDGVDVLSLTNINLKSTAVGAIQVGDGTGHSWSAFFDDAAFDTKFIA